MALRAYGSDYPLPTTIGTSRLSQGPCSPPKLTITDSLSSGPCLLRKREEATISLFSAISEILPLPHLGSAWDGRYAPRSHVGLVWSRHGNRRRLGPGRSHLPVLCGASARSPQPVTAASLAAPLQEDRSLRKGSCIKKKFS
jgi:hypothetical protein